MSGGDHNAGSRRTRLTPAPLPQAPLDDAQRIACLRLIRSENVGPVTFRELINRYGGAQNVIAMLPELSKRAGRTIRIHGEREAERELAAARRAGARPIFTIEPGYPPSLAFVEAPPPLVYVKGDETLLCRPAIAVVGSRNASAAGLKLTRQLADGFGQAGYVVVSGLARGIDATAHRAALATGTIAVVAGGADVVYPPEHDELQAVIGERGCIVTEQPPGFKPRAQDFPRRNRIISGMSIGVVIVEAAARSGTLVTARLAAEQGREVFAVPGHPLDPRAEGTNRLIKGGATLVTGPDDVLSALAPLLERPMVTPPPDAALEEVAAGTTTYLSAEAPGDLDRVLAALGPAPVGIDDLVRATGLPARVIQVALLDLSLAGRIERHGGQLVSLVG